MDISNRYKLLAAHVEYNHIVGCNLIVVAIESFDPGQGHKPLWKAYYVLTNLEDIIISDTFLRVAATGIKLKEDRASEIFPSLTKRYEYEH